MNRYYNYYFAKVNINENIFTSRENFLDIKNKFIPELILNFSQKHFDKVFYKNNGVKWTLRDVDRLSNNVIKGNLTKIHKTIRLKLHNVHTVKNNSDNVYTSRFYYYIRDEILVFQSTSKIPYEDFPTMFSRVLSVADSYSENKVGGLKIELLTYASKIRDVILKKPLSSMSITLVSPNDPKTANGFTKILTKTGSHEAKMRLNNKENGLKITNKAGKTNSIFHDVLDVIANGWGSIKARTLKGGHILSSNKYPIKVRTHYNDKLSKEQNIHNAIKTLNNKMGDIKNERKGTTTNN